MHKVEIKAGQEVIQTISEYAASHNIQEGVIASVIGAVDEASISNMFKRNPRQDRIAQYREPFELSGVGEIKEGKPHIHCVLSREGNEVIAGHLQKAIPHIHAVRVYIL